MDTMLAQDIKYLADKIRFDAACRNILSDKLVLAWILKGVLKEYQNEDIENIAKHIEQPEVGTARVEDTNAPERIRGMDTSDKSLYEGNVFYDLRFLAKTMDKLSELIINIEEQNDFYPGYPILKRAMYYCSRMISAQKGTVFNHEDYGKLRKVVSVWICPNPPKSQEYSLLRYSTKEEILAGNAERPVCEYDLTNIVLINLGDPADYAENNIMRLLAVLLSLEMKPAEKKRILEKDFKIPMTVEMKKEADIMCNLSDAIEQKGYKRGISQVILEMLMAKQPIDMIAKFTKFSKEKIVEIGRQNGVAVTI